MLHGLVCNLPGFVGWVKQKPYGRETPEVDEELTANGPDEG